MTVSVVYRGWTYDLVPTPGYNSHVSASTRQDSVPFIKPDLQPDNKVHNNRNIDSSSHMEEKLNIIGPDHQQYTQPQVTNFSQEVLAAVKLKLGRSHWDNDRFTRRLGSDIRGMDWEDPSGESKIPPASTLSGDARIGLDSIPFGRDLHLYHDQGIMELDTGLLKRPAPSPEPDRTLYHTDTVQTKYGGNTGYMDLHQENNRVTAENNVDDKAYTDLQLDSGDVGINLEQPQIHLSLESDYAQLALKYHNLGQTIMAGEKIKEGAPPPENDQAILNLKADSLGFSGSHLENSLERSLKDTIEFNTGLRSLSEALAAKTRTGEFGLDFQGRDLSLIGASAGVKNVDAVAGIVMPEHPVSYGPGPLRIGLYRADQLEFVIQDNPVELPGLEVGRDGVEVKVPPAPPDISIIRDRVGYDFATEYIHFNREPKRLPPQAKAVPDDVVFPNREVVAKTPVVVNQEQRPLVYMGIEERRQKVFELAPFPLSVQHRDSFLLQTEPFLLGMTEKGGYDQQYAQVSLAADLEMASAREDSWTLELLDSHLDHQPVIKGLKRLPFTDELPLEQKIYLPSFPSETIFATERADNPYDHRGLMRGEVMAYQAPRAPHDFVSVDKHLLEVNNVAKDPENQRRETITENQVYGRDHSLFTKVARLEEIRELEKFDEEIRYLEGKHTPPVLKGRHDGMPKDLSTLSIESIFWGWDEE